MFKTFLLLFLFTGALSCNRAESSTEVGFSRENRNSAEIQLAGQPAKQENKAIIGNQKAMENENEKPASDVILSCEINRSEEKLEVKYTVKNSSGNDIYVLDSYPSFNQETKERFAESKSFYACYKNPATVYMLKGIPPLPADKTVSMRVMPLGTKLAPQANLERTLEIPLPLREQSDWYYSPLELDKYEKATVNRLTFDVQFIRSTVDGFKAEPASFAPELFNVRSSYTVGHAQKVRCEKTLESLILLKRPDMFTRL